ncbi:MAG: flavodoxin domain-containing protein [Carbonactinosporaceae bacterium]
MAVLVAYAGAHGSTGGIAERIAATLRDRRLEVVVHPVERAEDAGAYDAVVIGSAIHNGVWLPAAAGFLRRNLDALGGRPLWLFSVSTLGDRGGAFRPRVARWLRARRKETKEITGFRGATHARDHCNFAGAIERDHLPAIGRVIFRAMGGRFGDHREWQEIHAWADGVAGQLLSAQRPADPRLPDTSR